jgi:uncharacterized protein YcbK (DUF882 family)
MITRNFSLDEFTRSETAEKLNIDNSIPEKYVANVHNLAVNVLQPTRDKIGALRINSGFRCPELNRAVGGVETSHHLTAHAADIYPIAKHKLKETFLFIRDNLKYTQLILYPNFIHVSYIPSNLKKQVIYK